MVTIVLIVQNSKETVYFRQVFLKAGLKIVAASPSYSSYIKTLQYDPDVVIMEIPADASQHLKFLRIIRGNKAIAQKPFILYGPPCDEQGMKNITDMGADIFLPRPLDMKIVIGNIVRLVKSSSDSKYQLEEKNQLPVDEWLQLIDPTVSKCDKMQLMRNHIGKLLAFPATTASILKVSKDEKSGAAELARVIRSDPAMSAEILKIANSVHFSRGGRRILDIKDAVVRIGFGQTKTIAMSLSVFKISRTQNYATGFNHVEYWLHCLAVAIIAEKISENSQLLHPEEGFITGLLHDLGTLLFNEFFNELFLKVLEKTTDEGIRFIECEDEIMGFNHNELMADLFAEWKFPDTLYQEVRYMCRTIQLTKDFITGHPLASVVSIADIIAKSFQLGRSVDSCIESIPTDVLEKLRYPFGISQTFIDKIYAELTMYNQILGVDNRVFPVIQDQVKDAAAIHLLIYSLAGEVFIPAFEYLRTQGYHLLLAKSYDEVLKKMHKFHIVILSGAGITHEKQIMELASMKTDPYTSGKSLTKQINNSETDCTKNPNDQDSSARLLVFGSDETVVKFNSQPGIIVSKSSLDLRTIDIALRCLLFDFKTDQLLNTKGTLNLKKTANSINVSFERKKILIGQSRNDIRRKFRDYFVEKNRYEIEETNEGPKLVNLAKTSTSEIHLVIIDLNIPLLSSFEVVKAIMTLPHHRRALFVITVKNPQKEQLLPLVKLGLRDFLNEESTMEELAKKFTQIGF
jgi:HD-like signal output (HDOD) protein/DNA-binding response OmpR family regulator